jgi:hypothetical protein
LERLVTLVVILPILIVLAVPVTAQIVPAPTPPPKSRDVEVVTAEAKEPVVRLADVDTLLSTWYERLASGVQFSYAVSDVADFRANSQATGASDMFVRNLDNSIWKGTTSLKMASMFTSVSDLSDAYGKLADYKQTYGFTGLAADRLDRKTHDRLIEYFTRTTGVNRFARFVSAFSVNASLLERAALDFGLNGPGDDSSDGTKLTFDVTFDPSSLFVTASQKKLAFEALTSYIKAYPRRAAFLRSVAICPKADECRSVNSLAGLEGAKAFAATLIPTMKVESVDEFDYAMVGGQPVLFPDDAREGSLQTVTLTWDLLKIIKPSSARREAVAAAKALDTLEKVRIALSTDPQIDAHQLPAMRAGQFITVALKATWLGLGNNPVTWGRAPERLWEIEGLYVTADGQLVGAPRCLSGASSCTGVITLNASSTVVERKVEVPLRIEVFESR